MAGDRLAVLFDELGRRRMTNLLIEGGSRVLGECFDRNLVDEACVFVAPKIVGGAEAKTPVAGTGKDLMAQALGLRDAKWETSNGDLYIRGRVDHQS